MNYQISTLRLGTQFDQEIVPLTVPGVAHRGNNSALCILDGANRAPRRLSRLVRKVGLLGIKVANPGDGVRVTLTLIADEFSTVMWNSVFRPAEEDTILEDEFRHHRLVEISAQGRTRGVLMLAHRRPDTHGARQQLQFDVAASEIGESGLLMFGLEEPSNLPSWASADLLEESLTGVCVANVKVDPLEAAPVGPTVSTGRPRRQHRAVAPGRPGFLVVNRGAARGPLTVSLLPREELRKPRPRGRRALVKAPLLAVREWVRHASHRDVLRQPVVVEAVGPDGKELVHRTVERSPGEPYRVEIPAGEGAVLLRAVVEGADRRRGAVDWVVDVTAGPRT